MNDPPVHPMSDPAPAPAPAPADPPRWLPPALVGLAAAVLLCLIFRGHHASDEYFVAWDNATNDRLRSLKWYDKNHFGATLQFFGLSRLPGVDRVEHFRAAAAACALLAFGLALRTARRHRVLGAPALVVFAGLLLTNAAFLRWGAYGLFNYAQMLLASVLAWYLALEWWRHRFRTTAAGAAGTCLLIAALVFGYLGAALPIAAAGLVGLAGLLLPRGRASDAPAGLRAGGWGLATLYAAVLAATAWVVRRRFTHAELGSPRAGVHPLFYPTSDEAAEGGAWAPLRYAVNHLSSWLHSAVEVHPGLGLPAAPLLVALAVGCSWGLWRGSVAFRVTLAWLAINAVGMTTGAVAGLLPLGDVRYGLFVQVPLLAVVAWGLSAGLGRLARWGGPARGPLGADPGADPGPSRRAWGDAPLRPVFAVVAVLAAAVAGRALLAGHADRRDLAEALDIFDKSGHLQTLVSGNTAVRVRYLGRGDGFTYWNVNGREAMELGFDGQVERLRALAAPRIRVVSTKPWPRLVPLDGPASAAGWPGGVPTQAPWAWITEHYRPVDGRAAGDFYVTVWALRPTLPGPPGLTRPRGEAADYPDGYR